MSQEQKGKSMDAANLTNALKAAGCPVKAVKIINPDDRSSWSFEPDPAATQAQIDAGNNVVATINPVIQNVISFSVFISRWTTTEYSNLGKARATAITNNGAGMTLVKNWDIAAAQNSVDLNQAAAQSFKAAIVAAGILTQPRADVIFS